MPDATLLSIIIVAYKSRDEIGSCLKSLPRDLRFSDESGGKVEVVVVDNSSGDGADEIVRRDFSWVHYVSAKENLGFGRANNLGYAQSNASSEFVLFLNPDTVCNEKALAHCLSRLREDASIGLISPKLVLRDGSMDLACRRSIPTLWDGFGRASGLAAAFPKTKWFSGYNLTYLPENGTYDVGAINGAFMMGRRAVFDAVAEKTTAKGLELRAESGSELQVESHQLNADRLSLIAPRAQHARVFDDRFFMYGDDLDLCIRVRKAGYRIVYDGSVSITHLKGVSVAKDYDAMARAIFDANRDVYLKHFNPHNSAVVRWKYLLAFAAWKRVALWKAGARGYKKVRPV